MSMSIWYMISWQVHPYIAHNNIVPYLTTDIDDNDCNEYSVCTDDPGSSSCFYDDGYSGDWVFCEGMYICDVV